MTQLTRIHQICLALKRIFVQDSIADKFLRALVKETEALKVNPPNLLPRIIYILKSPI